LNKVTCKSMEGGGGHRQLNQTTYDNHNIKDTKAWCLQSVTHCSFLSFTSVCFQYYALALSTIRDSCRQLFKQSQILSFPPQYIFSLLVFVTKNRGLFQSYSEIHDLHTRFNHNLHLPSTNLTFVQKGVLFSGSKTYNHLPSNIKVLSNDTKLFNSTLKS